MKSVMLVVSSTISEDMQSVGSILHSILCIAPIETPDDNYSTYNYKFVSKYIQEQFVKYFSEQTEAKKKTELFELIDGDASRCEVICWRTVYTRYYERDVHFKECLSKNIFIPETLSKVKVDLTRSLIDTLPHPRLIIRLLIDDIRPTVCKHFKGQNNLNPVSSLNNYNSIKSMHCTVGDGI